MVSQTKQIRNCGNSLLKQLIEGDTPADIRAKDQEYAVDAIVFATGF